MHKRSLMNDLEQYNPYTKYEKYCLILLILRSVKIKCLGWATRHTRLNIVRAHTNQGSQRNGVFSLKSATDLNALS